MKDICIVTGAASGLGYALSELLLKEGRNVCLVSRGKDSLETAEKKLKECCGSNELLAITANVGNEDEVEKVYKFLEEHDYTVKKVFNCAGQGQYGPPEDNTRKMIDTAFEGSLIGTILMSSKAIAAMKEKGGMIINIMSSAALKGNAGESVYCAAKWGARGFTEALKAYTKGSNIEVVGVYPGGMNTAFWGLDRCGRTAAVETFMDPYDVAGKILAAAEETKGLCVSDITIERR